MLVLELLFRILAFTWFVAASIAEFILKVLFLLLSFPRTLLVCVAAGLLWWNFW